MPAERVVYQQLCPIGTQRQGDVTRETAQLRHAVRVAQTPQHLSYTDADTEARNVAAAQAKVRDVAMELNRHAGHCTAGCKRAPGQTATMLDATHGPTHKLPPLPLGDLLRMLGSGASLDDIAALYQRVPETLRTTLYKAGYAADGTPVRSHLRPRPRAPYEPPEDLRWQERSLCAQTDPEAFFPNKGETTRAARAVCASCDVRAECLEYALTHQEGYGVWGGLSERDRRRIARDRRREGLGSAHPGTPEQPLDAGDDLESA